MQQLTLDIAPLPRPSLQNFVTGANTQLLSVLRSALAGATGEPRLCLWGGPSSGKSHLLAACAAAGRGGFLRCSDDPAGDAISPADSDTALLALDDVDELDAAGQIVLFNLINRRDARADAGTLIMSCSHPPAATGLRADLATRLAQGLVLEVVALTDAEKAAALARHAAERGMQLNDDVIRYLLTHQSRELPALIAVLDALDKVSLQMHRPITLPLLREILQTPADTGTPR